MFEAEADIFNKYPFASLFETFLAKKKPATNHEAEAFENHEAEARLSKI